MAGQLGSRKFFKYTDNAGAVWGIFADESNVELTQGETQDIVDNSIQSVVPRNIKPRKAKYVEVGGLGTITVPVLTAANYALLEAGDGSGAVNLQFTLGTATYALQSITPERRRFVGGFDTAQQDGDAT